MSLTQFEVVSMPRELAMASLTHLRYWKSAQSLDEVFQGLTAVVTSGSSSAKAWLQNQAFGVEDEALT